MQKLLFPLSMIAVLSIAFVALAKGPGGGGSGSTTLDAPEEIHLKFMRAEEKLARDVYYTLGQKYPDLAVFSNILESEKSHQDIMVEKLEQYELPDPIWDDSIPDSIGLFVADDYAWYFDLKFHALTNLDDATEEDDKLLQALKNGALIEELDIHDIEECPTVLVETEGFAEDGCGLVYTDEQSLIDSYKNLLEGSKDHLRAFVRTIESLFPDAYDDGTYDAQYLDQKVVDKILRR